MRICHPGDRATAVTVVIGCWLAVMLALGMAVPVGAHAEVVRAVPAEGDLLSAPPTQIEIWFSEPVVGDNGSLDVSLRTPGNRVIDATSITLDPNDARHVIAKMPPLGFETYTVVWQNQSVTDGHTISGSYTFRVGGGPTPGAATSAGGAPALWAVITRWLTFLGLATGAGAFFAAIFLLVPFPDDSRRRLVPWRGAVEAPTQVRLAAVVGLLVAVVASVAEVPLQWLFPPAGTARASFDNVLRGLPTDWWFRPVAGIAAIAIAVIWLMLGRRRAAASDGASSTVPVLPWAGLIVSLVALLGLALTGHSAARTGVWHAPAIISNALHQISAALWAGGLIMLAVIRWGTTRATGASLDPVRRFSPLALVLFAVAALTGIANAGIILPTVQALWESRYGVTILIKTALVLGALGLAGWHRRRLARSAAWATGVLRRTVRLETLVVAMVLLAAATLALTAPPVSGELTRDPAMKNLTLLQQVRDPQGNVVGIMRFVADPARPGETNTFTVAYADPNDQPVAIPAGSRVFLDIASVLDASVTQPRLELAAAGDGTFTGSGDQLSTTSWWQIDATIREVGKNDLTATFYVLLPDPNMYGNDAVRIPKSDPAAEQLYQRAYAQAARQTSYTDRQAISTGQGQVVFYDETIVAGPSPDANTYELSLRSFSGDGSPPTTSMTRRVGPRMWTSSDGGQTWISVFSPDSALSPADVLEQYDGATGFQLGRQQMVNGELSQALIFTVPASQYATTYYIWWIGVDSGRRTEEVMVTGGHYMTKPFTSYDTNPVISAPDPSTVTNAGS